MPGDSVGATTIDVAGQYALYAVPGAQYGFRVVVRGVIRPGYLIGDEVLRPAQVAVSG